MNQQNKAYKVLGIMSGTSFDGIDFCLASFQQKNTTWHYEIIAAETYEYSTELKEAILQVENGMADQLVKLHFSYGHFLGNQSKHFLTQHKQSAHYIASHGHTIFHQIENGFTFQLGHGAAIAAASGIPCISDFRSLDVALQGQGAPLVPIGDELLFNQYSCCINIGGIANLSYTTNEKRHAFDIAPANMVLNYISQKYNSVAYDKDGIQSRSGKLNTILFEKLNQLSFYSQLGPKSLGKEFVFDQVIPLIEEIPCSVEDKLHTCTKHLVHQIVSFLKEKKLADNVLVTGGGAKNKFLMELLTQKGIKITKTDSLLVDFKEAMIFAFLGILRVKKEVNTLMEVTGAIKNSSGGSIFFP